MLQTDVVVVGADEGNETISDIRPHPVFVPKAFDLSFAKESTFSNDDADDDDDSNDDDDDNGVAGAEDVEDAF